MDLSDREDRLASAQARSQLFWLLADGVLAGPWSESWSLVRDQATDSIGAADGPLAAAWRDMIGLLKGLGQESKLRLAVEHTRLFGGLGEGNGPPPPFESSWRRGCEPAEVTLAVVQSYAAAGFADIDLDAGPQDHLGVELKFMAMLALREAEAWGRNDRVGAETRISQQQAFLDHHLLGWVLGWADSFAQHTQEPVYWALAGLISAGLVSAAEDLSAMNAA